MGTILFKENLKRYYNQEAELRNKSDKADWKIKIREDFCNLIKQEHKKTLLELGAGAGYDSQFFMNNGLQVTAVDLSKEMVNKCKEKSVEAYELDFYNLSSLNKKFDCIWAMNTLLHVPKTDLCGVLNGINLALEENGLFYMGVYGGEDFESEYVKSEVSITPRFFSYYSESQLKTILENCFQIITFEEFDVSRGTEKDIFQSIIMRKR
jgi:cyclopropane fatty-acyl-phospholipid synthase-like methyltransferase